MASQLEFSVGIITETQLLEKEAKKTVVPGYRVVDAEGASIH